MEWIYLIVVAIIAILLSYATRFKPKKDLRLIDFFLVNSKTFEILKDNLDCFANELFTYKGYRISVNNMVEDGKLYVVYKDRKDPALDYTPYI